MLSIFLALLINFLGNGAGAATHPALHTPATGGHVHAMDTSGGPTG